LQLVGLYCTVVVACSGYLNTNVWEYKKNLEAMIDKLKAKGVENILVLVPPPVRGSSAQSLAEVVSWGVVRLDVLCTMGCRRRLAVCHTHNRLGVVGTQLPGTKW
jgi:hypothetical protein